MHHTIQDSKYADRKHSFWLHVIITSQTHTICIQLTYYTYL